MKDRVKAIRKEAGLTQTAFGERVGLSQNYIALIENGQRAPSDRTIRDICREFNVSEAWLRDGVEPMRAPQGREAELAAFLDSIMADRPDSFRSALLTTLLRFDPNGKEWEILENIYDAIAKERDPE